MSSTSGIAIGIGLCIGMLAVLGGPASAASVEPAALTLPAPRSIELYLDGARLLQSVDVPAGRSRISLPPSAGTLIGVQGADTWVEEQRIESVDAPPAPPELMALTTLLASLLQRQELVDQDQDTCQRLAGELTARLNQRGLGQKWEIEAWQAALDGLLTMQGALNTQTLALAQERKAFQERSEHEALPGLTFAQVLGEDTLLGKNDLTDPADVARRLWEAATTRSSHARVLMVSRAQAGPVTVVSERVDLSWVPQSRLLVSRGRATFVRQAAIHVPAGMSLPAVAARMVGGPRAQTLAGARVLPRWVAAGNAPVADRRTVTVTEHAADWDQPAEPVASREQTWDLAALTLRAPAEHDAEAIAELQKNAVPVLADEWVLAPDIAPVLVRRLSVRMDAHPLVAGMLELVVDGTVLGREQLAATAPGSLLQLAGGEDQRVFVAETKPWEEDPNRPANHKRSGSTYRVRNLSHDPVRFTCYLTRPVSAAKEVTVAVDPATQPGWTEAQAGMLRWELTLPPGQELNLKLGWAIDAAGKIRL